MITERLNLRELIRNAANRQDIVNNDAFGDHSDHVLDGLKTAGFNRVNTLNYSDKELLPYCIAHNEEHANSLFAKSYIVLKDPFGIEVKYGHKLNANQRVEANNYLDCALWLLDNRDNFNGQIIGVSGIYSYGDHMSVLNECGYIDKVILTKGNPLTSFSLEERQLFQSSQFFIGGMDIGDTVKWFSGFVRPSQLHVISDLNIKSPDMVGGSLTFPTFAHTTYGGVQVATHRKAGQVFDYVRAFR